LMRASDGTNLEDRAGGTPPVRVRGNRLLYGRYPCYNGSTSAEEGGSSR